MLQKFLRFCLEARECYQRISLDVATIKDKNFLFVFRNLYLKGRYIHIKVQIRLDFNKTLERFLQKINIF